jgi:hypothetical protein
MKTWQLLLSNSSSINDTSSENGKISKKMTATTAGELE